MGVYIKTEDTLSQIKKSCEPANNKMPNYIGTVVYNTVSNEVFTVGKTNNIGEIKMKTIQNNIHHSDNAQNTKHIHRMKQKVAQKQYVENFQNIFEQLNYIYSDDNTY